ncbi:MAG: DNA cytosine methyltransferase [Proteobacteria bacterium]|nr:DNA cytosine methyltransferase [Pseudomonadota bacterium]NOG59906.1 DNA cytosine methyltransferase [Pseudomonadota bacterium]
MSKPKKIYAIDLFCGVGGLTYGLQKAGISVLAGIDIDSNCEYPYQYNNRVKFICKDICKITKNDINEIFPSDGLKLLAGCAPCQPFSTYTQGRNDNKWKLVNEFSRLVQETEPDFVTMENVPSLIKHKAFRSLIKILDKCNYQYNYEIVDCTTIGLAQTRKRLVLIASKHSDIELLKPYNKEVKSLFDVIGKMEKIKAGEQSKNDPLHTAASLTNINLKRIKQSKPGGTWRDWNSKIVTKCHKKHTGKFYSGVYGRLEWNKPSSTITTQFFGYGNGRFGHPEQNRALSIREGALIQGFPKKYKFLEGNSSIKFTHLGRLIGNAVPPKLGHIIGNSIVKSLDY